MTRSQTVELERARQVSQIEHAEEAAHRVLSAARTALALADDRMHAELSLMCNAAADLSQSLRMLRERMGFDDWG